MTDRQLGWFLIFVVWTIGACLLFTSVGCMSAPNYTARSGVSLSITEVKVNDDCECIEAIAWTTSEDTRCTVFFCERGQCFSTGKEPEWGKLHFFILPKESEPITIIAESKDGSTCSLQIK